MPAGDALVDAVAEELERAGRGVSALELPELRRIWARSQAGVWDDAALELLLRHGIEALGGGVGDTAVRVRAAELGRSLAAVLVARESVHIKLESRDNLASMLANLPADETTEAGRRVVKPVTAAVALVTAVAVAVGVTLVVAKLVAGGGGPDDELKTASSSSPPLKIQDVTNFRNSARDQRYVLSEAVTEPPPGVVAVNETAESFGTWYQKHGGTALDYGFTNITVQGNDSKPVRITDMKIAKQCSAPLDGTFLKGYTQGGERETIKIAFDLDTPNPIPEQMTALEIVQGTGRNYFAVHTIELGPGEAEVLTVGAFTKRPQHCKFTLQLVVATANGTFVQDVDSTGKQFEVTGKAPAENEKTPYSGYQKLYLQDSSLSWKSHDPKSAEGN
ncbi:hypothetical protein [Lentzea kentuckyensis]|uniref:hypothetical protein n=1 Tax=Lentzea kentuckyensis TaxID=360086 RepID=UPI000A363C8B|nr:hypothetical protein [Lentzea kentuckyensis]